MNTTRLVKRAVASALGVLLYVGTFAWLMNHAQQWLGNQPDTWLDPVLFLLMFIVSASITGSLVLLKPILLYVEGNKKEAVQLFAYTVASLAVIAILIGGFLVIQGRSGDVGGMAGQRCGGNIKDAPTCASGFHCAAEPGSNLPVGDVGGICVQD